MDGTTTIGAEVHVLEWVHQHGNEVTVHATWEGLVAEKADIARRGWDGLRALYPDLPVDPPEDDAEAAEMYFSRLNCRHHRTRALFAAGRSGGSMSSLPSEAPSDDCGGLPVFGHRGVHAHSW
ncbi:hypothetical protein AAH979_41430 [Plantactinospora sp. ZYX-F-223]|uniref:hypothetical protein n=1 Tax=Plantactinospora sp. ZYX-F-223 TaxID=3144103 RepID=UPI0031FC7CFE